MLTHASSAMKSLIIAAALCLLSLGWEPPRRLAHAQSPNGQRKVLIVYLSRTNNTKAIAEIIHEKVGGTLIPLELETPYPAD